MTKIATAVALLLGSMMLTMAALVLTSAQPQVPQRISVAPIVVGNGYDPEDFTEPPRLRDAEALVAALEAVRGVRQAIPDTPVYAQAVIDGRPSLETIGNSYAALALSPWRLVSGRGPSGDGEVVMSQALGRVPGDRVTIVTAAGPSDYTVSGTIDGPGFFFKTSSLVRAIGVLGENVDPSEVERVVAGRARVLTGDERAVLEPAADARKRWIGLQVITGLTALSTFAAIFLVASTFSLSVLQRRRELGLWRAIGATPGQVRRLLLREALVLGVAASALGGVLGAFGAPVLGSLLIDGGFEPASFRILYSPWPIVAAFGVGLFVALAGVWVASQRAARARPLEALRAADAERTPMTKTRWVFGLGCLALGAFLGVATAAADALTLPTLAAGAAMALTAAMSLLAPVFVPPLARVAMAPLRRGAVGLLVRQNAFTAASRTASTAAPVLLSVSFAVLIGGMVQTSASAYAARRADSLPAQAVLVPDGTPGLSEAAVRSVSGIALTPTTAHLGSKPLAVLGRSDVENDSVTAAARLGLSAGQTIEVTVADGQVVALTISAVSEEQSADLVVARDWVPRNDKDALTQAVLLPEAPAGSPVPGSRVIDSATYAAEADAEEDRLVWTFTLLLIAMACGFTVLAVANTLLMASVARRPELAALSRVGTTRGQLLRLLAAETTLVVLLGTALGLLAALPALAAIRSGLAAQVGQPIPLVIPWSALATVTGACLLVALAAALTPHLPSRQNPAGLR